MRSGQIQELFSGRISKLILNFIFKCKGPKIAKIILKKNKSGVLTLPDIKTYKPAVTKTIWY